jgi:carboxyl-terminal processing protease
VNKSLRNLLIGLIAILGLTVSFAGGFVTGHLIPLIDSPATDFLQLPITALPPTPSESQNQSTPEDLRQLFRPFWEAWNIVHEQYLVQPVDDLKLMQGAIQGMISALGDKHSSFMDPKTYQAANQDLSGEYEGIGAYVDTTTAFLTIISPMPDSPAERAGLHAGDQVIAIDGEDMTGINGELVRLKIIGPAGTHVHLTVTRDGESIPLEFDIEREKIEVKSASGKMLDSQVGYIELTTFGDRTSPELEVALKELMAKNPQGLILDLRNNGGGYLEVAIQATSQFMSDGVVLYEEYSDGRRQEYRAYPGGLATVIPLIIIVNEGSASASEILAGALQDLGRATLVGEVTYGKGSVQNWVPLSDEQGAVRITIAKWLTPKGRTIHEEGLTPDHIVEMTTDDYQAGRDPQLDKALEIMHSMISKL